jgi:cystathionine beta-lyase/cystathionine gamma-synthase
MVDNTFMTPLLQRPLNWGADLVIHSATKFLGGHSDLILGLVSLRDSFYSDRLGFLQNAIGAVPSPFDCWLTIRGMKTLRARMQIQQQGAQQIVSWLLQAPEIEEVYWPGLPEHPGVSIHQRQADGAGAIISFRVKSEELALRILHNVKIWSLAVSLGAVESIITYPLKMTHNPYPPEKLNRLGIDGKLIRLSVGLEDPEDLIEDLKQSFSVKK